MDLTAIEQALGAVLDRSGPADAALEMLERLLLNSDHGVRRAAKAALGRPSMQDPDRVDWDSSPNVGAEVLPAVVDAEPAPIPNGRTAGHDEEAGNSLRRTTNSPVAALGSGVRRTTRG